MKITRDTPEQLILDYTPWIFAIGISAVTLAVTGVGISNILQGDLKGFFPLIIGGLTGGLLFVFFVERTQAIFDKTTGHVTLRRRTVFRYDQVQFDLADIDQAVLQRQKRVEQKRFQSDMYLYRPAIEIGKDQDKGVYPLREVYGDDKGPQDIVDRINQWLAKAKA
ncbi:hypothetical protein [Pseudaestuariivita rosea]|uniref:hypothetical protein n=1 Tax=Pseudaestuariivita rosea TaxID=2763263 RepID=UPI001ABA7D9B|nr:hypothetical protein [Pseudaestuariivita rosea]